MEVWVGQRFFFFTQPGEKKIIAPRIFYYWVEWSIYLFFYSSARHFFFTHQVCIFFLLIRWVTFFIFKKLPCTLLDITWCALKQPPTATSRVEQSNSSSINLNKIFHISLSKSYIIQIPTLHQSVIPIHQPNLFTFNTIRHSLLTGYLNLNYYIVYKYWPHTNMTKVF